MKLQCKYNSATSVEKIQDVAKENGFTYTNDLTNFVLLYNNGIIIPNKFDSEQSKGYEVKTILSYNKEDMENVYTAIEILKEEGVYLIPFAYTPSGDFICLEINNAVVLWKHETSIIERISPTFSLFIDSLY